MLPSWPWVTRASSTKHLRLGILINQASGIDPPSNHHHHLKPSPCLHQFRRPKLSPSPSSSPTTVLDNTSPPTMPIPPLPPTQSSSSTIKTRLLILSDTHSSIPPSDPPTITTQAALSNPKALADSPSGFRSPLPEADVVLHCGDLTKRGRPEELQRTFSMLRELKAPLKLVIAGNHDLALDERLNDKIYYDPSNDLQAAHRKALQIAKEAEQDGVRYLTEGTYTFNLPNGSTLRIFASPWTPRYGTWAFQYEGMGAHSFDIPQGVDVAMTHGPPLGVLDQTWRNENAGCGDLFRSIHRAKPRIHCFGHIHEAWGAQLMRWRPNVGVSAEAGVEGTGLQAADSSRSAISPASAVDWENSRSIYTLAPPPVSIPTNSEVAGRETQNLVELSRDGGCYLDVTQGENAVRQGEQTLFVNASIMSVRYRPAQMPWVVDIDLPRATELT
ncbi:Metallo-dependent phosphatase [Trichoderma aethiopicum]